MTVKFSDEVFMRKFEAKKKTFLHAVGHVAVNQAAESSHVDTGLSKNAKHYVLSSGEWSGFGKYPGEKPSIRYKGPKPKMPDSVKIIAPLHYDVYLERRYGILKRTKDLIRPAIRSLGRLLKV